MLPSLISDHHPELETKPPEGSGESRWNFQVCSRQSERTLGQQTPPLPDKHTGEAVSQESRCTEQNRMGGQGGIQQTKGLRFQLRYHLEEGRANLHPAR